MLSKYDNIIFDLDGTLINSSEEVLHCFKKAFKTSNCKIDKSELTSDIIGPPIKQIIQNITHNSIADNKIEEIIKNFRQIYDYDENDISVMYSGILDLLTYLKKQNKKLFIATFKPEKPTMRVVKMFNIESLFDGIYTIDKFNKTITKSEILKNIIKEHNLITDQTVMIGDTLSDMIAAKENNITGIGVLWGYGPNKTTLKENSTYMVNEVKDFYVKN